MSDYTKPGLSTGLLSLLLNTVLISVANSQRNSCTCLKAHSNSDDISMIIHWGEHAEAKGCPDWFSWTELLVIKQQMICLRL